MLYILNILACILTEESQRELFLILFPVLFVIQLFFVLLSQWSIDFQCFANFTKVMHCFISFFFAVLVIGSCQ